MSYCIQCKCFLYNNTFPLTVRNLAHLSIYIKAKPADFVCVFVCCEATAAGAFSFWSVLGLFLIGSGGVFFLVSSRSVSYWSQQQWGGIFFGVRSEGIFLCLIACRISETHYVWRSWTSGIYGGWNFSTTQLKTKLCGGVHSISKFPPEQCRAFPLVYLYIKHNISVA
jgi:hypothetical protein